MEAVRAVNGGDAAAEGSISVAPPAAFFKKVWEGARKTASLKDASEDAGRFKNKKIIGLLAHAMKAKDREFLQKATVVSLVRDASHNRLAIRFVATDPNVLVLRKGILGMKRDFGSSSSDITTATMTIMEWLFTDARGHLEEDALDKFRHRVLHLAVDAASDEITASRQMVQGLSFGMNVRESFGTTERIDKVMRGLTPNLLVVSRDKSHATRRFLSRTFKTRPRLLNVHERWLSSKKSLIAVITNSEQISGVFESCHSFSFSFVLSHSLSFSLILSRSLSFSLSFFLSISLSFSLSLSLSFSLEVSLSLSHYLSYSLSFSRPVPSRFNKKVFEWPFF